MGRGYLLQETLLGRMILGIEVIALILWMRLS